jgi:hypothetical protein
LPGVENFSHTDPRWSLFTLSYINSLLHESHSSLADKVDIFWAVTFFSNIDKI